MGLRERAVILAASGGALLAGCGGFPPSGSAGVGEDGRLILSGTDSVNSAAAVDPIFDVVDALRGDGEITEESVRGALTAAGYDAEDIDTRASDSRPGVFYGVRTGGVGCVSGFVDDVSVSAYSTGLSVLSGCVDTSGVTE